MKRTCRLFIWILMFLICSFAACIEQGEDVLNPPSTLVEMITVPGGIGRMGDIVGNANKPDEIPVHQVSLRPYMVSKYEVTQELYMQVMGNNPSAIFGNMANPVENVTWYDAVRFCNALSTLEGLTPCYAEVADDQIECDFNTNGYRLPTEAEWEYACRAGTGTAYHSGGNEEDVGRAAWYAANAGGESHPVGMKEANAFDLYDMHGNVSEWCWDWYDPSYYSNSSVDDPLGPTSGMIKVTRGGSYFMDMFQLRSSSRANFLDPVLKDSQTGFRVVRSVL